MLFYLHGDLPSLFRKLKATLYKAWEISLHEIRNMVKDDLVSLRRTGLEIRQIIRNGEWPEDLKTEIKERYKALSRRYDQDITDVAVRSSATAEDLPDASFAGQQDTYLNVRLSLLFGEW